METRPVRRAAALATIAALAFAGVASADIVRTDGDAAAGSQSFIDLGVVGPSATISAQVAFDLTCSNLSHVDPGQLVTLDRSSQTVPLDGAVVSSTSGTTATAPADWTPDTQACPFPAPVVSGGTPSTVTLKAPSVAGAGYLYTVSFRRTVSPTGNDDPNATRGTTAITFELEVVANTPPVLDVPGDTTVEGDTAGGWTADWPGVTAADAEDNPDPTPVCSPAAGEVLPLGATSVTCAVTDGGGLADEGAFTVTVVDTTAPSIGDPDDVAVSTGDAGGTTVTYASPSATDVVDAAPTVGCVPASGGTFPVGSTTVTCTARDASGNEASSSFVVDVAYDPVHTASAVWGEPVGADGGVFVANRGRTLPLKVMVAVDGTARATGVAGLRIVPCGGGEPLALALTIGGGRWNASLDTSLLGGSCYTVTAHVDGIDAGTFQLDLRGSDPAAKAQGRTR